MARFGSVALQAPRLTIALPASVRTLVFRASAPPSVCVLRHEQRRRSETERRIAQSVISWLFLGCNGCESGARETENVAKL